MSKIDQVFGPIPGPLIQEWGQAVTFVKVAGDGTYDPATGTVTATENRMAVKAVITKVHPEEYNGVAQTTDLKILIDPGQLGGSYISTGDRWEYPEGSVTRTAKVVDVSTYRGDGPVFFVCLARPQ